MDKCRDRVKELLKKVKKETWLKIQIVGGLSLFFNSSIYMHANMIEGDKYILSLLCYIILVTISIYFVVDGILHFFDKKIEENKTKYETILKVERAFYVMLKQKWGGTNGRSN